MLLPLLKHFDNLTFLQKYLKEIFSNSNNYGGFVDRFN